MVRPRTAKRQRRMTYGQVGGGGGDLAGCPEKYRQSQLWDHQSIGGSSTQTSHKNQSSRHARSGTRKTQKICR